MDQSSFLVDGYTISLHMTQENLIIEAEDIKTDKLYKHTATDQAIKALNLFFLTNADDLQDLLKLGFSKSDPKTKTFIEAGPILNIEANVSFGKTEKISKVQFKLEEQNISSIENCERILNSLLEEGLKAANPVESQIIKVLKDLVRSVKKTEKNITNISKDAQQKIGAQNKQGPDNKVDERIVELEKNINVRLDQIEKKALEAKVGDIEERFAEVNKKIDSLTQLLTNTSRHVSASKANETAFQAKLDETVSKVDQLQKVIQGSEGNDKSQDNKVHDSRLEQLATDIACTVRELDKTKEQIHKLEALSNKLGDVKKVAAPAIAAPADVVKSESITANNYDIEFFKTSQGLVIQVVDAATSTAYSKTVSDSHVKGLTLNSYTDTAALYDALAELVKTEAGSTAFSMNEGKLTIIGLKKKVGVSMEKVEAEVAKAQDVGTNDARFEQLSSDIARVANELDKTKEHIYKLETISNKTDKMKNTAISAIPAIAVPADVVKSESITSNNYDIKLFKTSQGLVIQVVDTATSTAYSKTVSDSHVKGLTLNSYTDTVALYDALAELVKTEAGSTAFSMNEGKLTIIGLKKKVGVSMEKVEAEVAKAQDVGKSDTRFDQLSSDLARIANELDKTKEQIQKLEAAPKNVENAQNTIGSSYESGAPYSVIPLTEIVQAESFVVNGFEVELFKTTRELLIQAEDLATSKIYYKIIGDSHIKGLTINMFTNFGSLFEFIVELSKSDTASTAITFTEGKLGIVGPKKKFVLTLEKAELESFAACERIVKKFTDKSVETQSLFEKGLKEAMRKIFDQEKKLFNMAFETVMKLEQVEKTVEDL